MIKCEVCFDGDNIVVNGYTIEPIDCSWYVSDGGGYFYILEQAIKYCMERNQ